MLREGWKKGRTFLRGLEGASLAPDGGDDDDVAGGDDERGHREQRHRHHAHVQLPLPLLRELDPALQPTFSLIQIRNTFFFFF